MHVFCLKSHIVLNCLIVSNSWLTKKNILCNNLKIITYYYTYIHYYCYLHLLTDYCLYYTIWAVYMNSFFQTEIFQRPYFEELVSIFPDSPHIYYDYTELRFPLTTGWFCCCKLHLFRSGRGGLSSGFQMLQDFTLPLAAEISLLLQTYVQMRN